MWAFSVNYAVFLDLIVLECFFSKEKGTFFVTLQQIGLHCTAAYDGIAIWNGNPLCVAFFVQRMARPRNTIIRLHLFYQSQTHAELA